VPEEGRPAKVSPVRDELVRLIKLLVDAPDQVEVDEERHGDATTFRLTVAPQDLGKVIGRQGRTARAVRSLLAGRGAADGERYEFEIIDD
jgi:predicted RNA-binding protein YlqC (UPF0109 family)